MPEGEEKKIINTIAKGAGMTAIGLVFSKFFTYLYRALVGRYLGPEAYGMLTTGIMIVGIASTLSGSPIKQGLKKFIPEYRDDNNTASIKGAILSALKINFIGSLIVGTAIFFSAEFIAVQIFENTALIPIIKVMGFVPILSRPYNIFLATTIGFNKAKYKVITANFFQNIIQLGVTAALLYTGMNIMGAVWGWVAGIALSLILAFYFMEKKLGPLLLNKITPENKTRELVIFSYPLMMSSIIGIALGWTDTAFIGYFLDQSAVGLYNAAYPIAIALTIPSSAMGTLALSSFSEMNKKDQDTEYAIKTITRWIFTLTFPAFLLMALFSDQVLNLLFGKEFIAASTALVILSIGNITEAATGKISQMLKSRSHTKIIFYNTIANLALNLVLNIYLIPRYGITGAAIATASSTIFVNLLLVAEGYKFEKINPFTWDMLRVGLSGLISLAIVYITVDKIFQYTPIWALIPSGIIFMILFLAIYLKTGGLKEYDKEIAITAGRKAGYEKETRKILDIID